MAEPIQTIVQPSAVPLWTLVLIPLVGSLGAAWLARDGRADVPPPGADVEKADDAPTRSTGLPVAVASLAAILPAVVGLALALAGSAERMLYTFATSLLRAGSLDAPLAFTLDRFAAWGLLAVGVISALALLAGRVCRTEPLRPGAFVAQGMITASAALAVLAENLVVALLAAGISTAVGFVWLAAAGPTYRFASAATRVTAHAAVGDALLAAAAAILFWSLGGQWLAEDRYVSDYRPRFEAQVVAPETQIAVPGVAEKTARLTMTAHPGAQVFLGVQDARQLTPDRPPIAESPAFDVEIPAGVQLIAIRPSPGVIVAGDGVESALLEHVSVPVGAEVLVRSLGATLSFEGIGRERTRGPEASQGTVPLAKRLLLDTAVLTWVALLAGAGALLRLTAVAWCGRIVRERPGVVVLAGGLLPAVATVFVVGRLFDAIAPGETALVALAALAGLAAALTAFKALATDGAERLVAAVASALSITVFALAWTNGTASAIVAVQVAIMMPLACMALSGTHITRVVRGLPIAGVGLALPLGAAWVVAGALAESLEADAAYWWIGSGLAAVGVVLTGLSVAHLIREAAPAKPDPKPKSKSKASKKAKASAVATAQRRADGQTKALVGGLVAGLVALVPGLPLGEDGRLLLTAWLEVPTKGSDGLYWAIAAGLILGIGGAVVLGRGLEPSARAEQITGRGQAWIGARLLGARRIAGEIDRVVVDIVPSIVERAVAGIEAIASRQRRLRVGVAIFFGALVFLFVAALAGAAHAHQEEKPAAPEIALPTGGPPGVLAVHAASGGVELSESSEGRFSGTFEIENAGAGILTVHDIFIRQGLGDAPISPPGFGVTIDRGGKSVKLAPGERRAVTVEWDSRVAKAREAYGEIAIESDGAAPHDPTVLGGPKFVRAHAELADLGGLTKVLLSVLWMVPLVAGVAALVLGRRPSQEGAARLRRVIAGLMTAPLAASLLLLVRFDRSLSDADGHRGFQFIELAETFRDVGAEYFVGVDGVSVACVASLALAAWLTVWLGRPSHERLPRYLAITCFGTAFGLLSVVALDLFLWQLAMLAALVCAVLLMHGHGGEAGRQAARRLGLVGFASTVSLLAGLSLLVQVARKLPAQVAGSGWSPFGLWAREDLDGLALAHDTGLEAWLPMAFVLIAVGVALRLPLPPFHSWWLAATKSEPSSAALPVTGWLAVPALLMLARVPAETVPQAVAWASPGLTAIGAAGVLWCGIGALASRDLRELVSYGTAAVGSAVLAAIGSMTPQGLQAAAYLAALMPIGALLGVAAIGFLTDRVGEGHTDRFGGLFGQMPKATITSGIALFGLAGVPGLGIGWGVLLALWGVAGRYPWLAIVLAVGHGLVLAAMGWSFARAYFGFFRASWKQSPALADHGGRFPDLSRGDRWPWIAALALVLLGLYPRPLFALSESSVLDLHRRVDPPGQTQIALRADGPTPFA